ncbi:MAG: hypothetical protein GY888_06225, partial [Planctomycetaceae bacterium]|nr:hypothetical protein [Planctomycetaceae bacterium]
MKIHMLGCIALACGLLSARPATGQDLPTAAPDQLRVSAERLKHGVKLFRDAIAEDRLRNVELLVMRDG